MSLDADQLYALLPAVYRTRDAVAGGQLQALFAVLAQQSGVVEDNIKQLYDDQFIETCAPWVIPYLGDLVGYSSIYGLTSTTGDSRAEVANTIGSRRRKGTLLALEQVSMDVSGRAAVAIEEFQRLITTESMRHVEPSHEATVDMRNGRALDRLGTPFDVGNHTIDVRRIAPRVRHIERPDAAPLEIALHGPGRFNIPNVAIHLWRVQSWPVTGAPAVGVGSARYKFSPFGADMPLFSRPRPRTSFEFLTTRLDVPAPIKRHELHDFYGGPHGSVMLLTDGVPVPAEQIYAANLADRPGGSRCVVPAGKIAVDPELGRIQFAADVALPTRLELSYCYGFPAPIGGGTYDRSAALTQLPLAVGDFFAVVGSSEYPTIESAVAAWNGLASGSRGVIVLRANESLTIDLTGRAAVRLPAESSLAIVTATAAPDANQTEVVCNEALVTLTGDIEVTGIAGPPSVDGSPAPTGQLLINGPWIAGQLLVDGAPSTVQLTDTTLVPGLGLVSDGAPLWAGEPSVIVASIGATLILNRAISGPIAVDGGGTTRICASIVDATSPGYVAYAGPDLASAGGDLHIEDSTVVGKVRTRTLTLASNTIFHARLARRDPWPAAVWASRRQAGCVRFCVLPYDSITPRRYHCLAPDPASENALEPSFVTLSYGAPAYALLSGDCPMAVWTGAANGSQIGAYLQIQETEAVSNVELRAPEYLPALLESGVFIHPSRPQPIPLPMPSAYGYGSGPRWEDEEPDLPGIGAGLI
ncbi:MAG: hypothetical protein M3071_05130 [Actinomycetota bacterium]|nr:hypothetical protein [Actinomycetota bacterium]